MKRLILKLLSKLNPLPRKQYIPPGYVIVKPDEMLSMEMWFTRKEWQHRKDSLDINCWSKVLPWEIGTTEHAVNYDNEYTYIKPRHDND